MFYFGPILFFLNTVNTYKYCILKLQYIKIENTRFQIPRLLFFGSIMPHCENVCKEAQSSVDNLWIFKFSFTPFWKIMQSFLGKLIKPTLVKLLLEHIVLSYGRCLFCQSSLAFFLPGAFFAENTNQHSFIISLVAIHNKVGSSGGEGFLAMIVSYESGCGYFDSY